MCNSNPLIWGKYCSIGIRGSVRRRPSGASANNQCSNWGGFSAVHNVSLSRCFLSKLHVITWSTDQRMRCTFPIFYWQKLVQCGHNSCIIKASQDHPENNTLPIFHTIHDPRWLGGLLPPFQRQQSAQGARTVLASTFLPPQKLSSSSPYHPFSPRGLIDSCFMSHAWEEGSTLKWF